MPILCVFQAAQESRAKENSGQPQPDEGFLIAIFLTEETIQQWLSKASRGREGMKKKPVF